MSTYGMTKTHLATWDEFQTFLQDQLDDEETRANEAAYKFMRLRHGEDEPIRQFMREFHRLLAEQPRIYSEKDKVNEFRTRLNSARYRDVATHPHPLRTVSAIYQHCRRAEGRERVVEALKNEPVRIFRDDESDALSLHCTNCGNDGYAFRRCPKIVCHTCYKKGHIPRDCPARS